MVEEKNLVTVTWPSGNREQGVLKLDMKSGSPLFSSIQLKNSQGNHEISHTVDPLFLLTLGQRDLSKESGWDIFLDRTAYNPY